MSKILAYFEKRFDLDKPVNGWYRFHNPLYAEGNSKSCGLNLNSGWVHDFREGYSESVWKFICDVENVNFSEAKRLIESQTYRGRVITTEAPRKNKKGLKLPKHAKPIKAVDSELSKQAADFLKSKGIKSKGLYFCDKGKYRGRVIIPIVVTGQLEYFIARDFIGNEPRYLNIKGRSTSDIFYNQDALYIEDTVYITEGWSDAYSIGKKAVATLGWSWSVTKTMILANSPVTTFIIVSDKGFYSKACENALFLIEKFRVKVIDIDKVCVGKQKDVNDVCLTKKGRKRFKQLVADTPLETLQSLLDKTPLPF